jgi:hypothetical protein
VVIIVVDVDSQYLVIVEFRHCFFEGREESIAERTPRSAEKDKNTLMWLDMFFEFVFAVESVHGSLENV